MDGLKNFKKHKPCPIEKMNAVGANNTICELLRQTYHLTDNDMIRINLRIAITMAKKMGEKLREYRRKEDIRNGN
jgi:uncharacterized protein YehS (DUF1456 family)